MPCAASVRATHCNACTGSAAEVRSVPPAPASASASATPAPAQATPGNLGNKQIAIEWWRRNYAPGSQNAETITSDAAVKGFHDRFPSVSITIQGGPFGPETDQKFDIA